MFAQIRKPLLWTGIWRVVGAPTSTGRALRFTHLPPGRTVNAQRVSHFGDASPSVDLLRSAAAPMRQRGEFAIRILGFSRASSQRVINALLARNRPSLEFCIA